MRTFKSRYPVDSLILGANIIAGSYSYEDGVRKGEVSSLDVNTGEVLHSKGTSGTFNIKKWKGLVFSANVSSVKIMKEKNLEILKSHETACMNMDIDVAEEAACTVTEDGKILLFDQDLSLVSGCKVSEEILWSVFKTGSTVYTGGDSKCVYEFDTRTGGFQTVLDTEDVVTMVHIDKNLLHVGSYGGNIEVYDVRNYRRIMTKNVGGAWRMRVDKDKICVSCIFSGVKVFTKTWDMVRSFDTASMAYAIDMYNDDIVFSSFYEKKVFMDHIYI